MNKPGCYILFPVLQTYHRSLLVVMITQNFYNRRNFITNIAITRSSCQEIFRYIIIFIFYKKLLKTIWLQNFFSTAFITRTYIAHSRKFSRFLKTKKKKFYAQIGLMFCQRTSLSSFRVHSSLFRKYITRLEFESLLDITDDFLFLKLYLYLSFNSLKII